jgi:hypothetical protein
MSERKAVIKNADMSEDMQQDAIDCSTQARATRPRCRQTVLGSCTLHIAALRRPWAGRRPEPERLGWPGWQGGTHEQCGAPCGRCAGRHWL